MTATVRLSALGDARESTADATGETRSVAEWTAESAAGEA
jgi:hypothetical protein